MATSGAEEYDPATGTFRPIRRASVTPAQHKTAQAYQPKRTASGPRRAAGNQKPAERPQLSGLSESGNKYGVFYEMFEGAAMSPTGKILHTASKVVIAVVFLLLIYEAISYRLAQG
jgi:hypothetical protein